MAHVLTDWDRVERSRQMECPVVGGIALFHGILVTVIAQQKGKTPKITLPVTLACHLRKAIGKPCA